MPSSLGQLTLVIQLSIRDLARIPAAILFVPEHRGPKALQVVARFGIHTLHFSSKEIVQHPLVEFLWMLMNSFASHRKDCARLKADRHRRSIVAEVVKEGFEVLSRRLEGFFTLEHALW